MSIPSHRRTFKKIVPVARETKSL